MRFAYALTVFQHLLHSAVAAPTRCWTSHLGACFGPCLPHLSQFPPLRKLTPPLPSACISTNQTFPITAVVGLFVNPPFALFCLEDFAVEVRITANRP